MTRKTAAPSTSKPPLTDELILLHAQRALAAHGYTGLNMRSLARELDVSLMTIQRRFKTKDILWRACVDAAFEAMPTLGFDIRSPGQDLIERHICRLIEVSRRMPGLTAAIWNDTSPGAADRLQYLTAKMTPRLRQAKRTLRLGTKAGIVNPIDADTLLALISIGISSLISADAPLRELFDIDMNDETARRTLAKNLSTILKHGVRKK